MAFEQKNKALMKQIWKAAIYNVNTPSEAIFDKNIDETLKQRNLIDIDWALMTFNMSKTQNGVAPGDGSIEDVKTKVLSIYGEKDLVIPTTMFEEIINALNHVETEIYQEGSHSPITDFPQELSNRILKFIDKN